MDEKIVAFTKDEKIYRELARRSIEKEDYEGSFISLFSALELCEKPYEIYAELADAYSLSGQFDKAIEYWFKYIDNAPEDKASAGYEGLYINFYYQDKMLEAGYYFEKKVLSDGFVSNPILGDEIASAIEESFTQKGGFHIAYPFDRADFSQEKKRNKNTSFRASAHTGVGIP